MHHTSDDASCLSLFCLLYSESPLLYNPPA